MSARRVVVRAFGDAAIREAVTARPVSVVAVGKAAAGMATTFVELPGPSIRRVVAIATHAPDSMPVTIEWIEASHPFPDQRSEYAASRALDVASGVAAGETLVVLLSGGASSLMSAPIDGLTLSDKIRTTRLMMESGADIHALNTVRRHLSRVKGGRLAAACAGRTVTLAISDVIGDDLAAIGSG
ncbi:MAG: glycerate-2-kinase family protein, partial [Vicinamibacterales bacterium]